MEDLALDDLECHLNWKPRNDPFTESPIKNIIAKTERKIVRYPQFTVAYCCTLAYLHILKDINDFNKAHELLKESNLSIKKQNYQPEERWLDCDFIVRANRLKLKKCEKRSVAETTAEELEYLNILWTDDKTKAVVYAVKGVTFSSDLQVFRKLLMHSSALCRLPKETLPYVLNGNDLTGYGVMPLVCLVRLGNYPAQKLMRKNLAAGKKLSRGCIRTS